MSKYTIFIVKIENFRNFKIQSASKKLSEWSHISITALVRILRPRIRIE